MKNTTLDQIHQAAYEEFLEKGFKSASLRQIVRKAGVTTGAFYGYYRSKEELFSALVKPVYDHILQEYKQAHEIYSELDEKQRIESMTSFSEGYVFQLFEYCFDHKRELVLILKKSEGTVYSNLVDQMVDIETQATEECYELLEKNGQKVAVHNRKLDHILATGTVNSCFELILHDFSREEMRLYLTKIWEFYQAGWKTVLGL